MEIGGDEKKMGRSPSVVTFKIASRYYLCKTKWLTSVSGKIFLANRQAIAGDER
jgi:hypothetical protein